MLNESIGIAPAAPLPRVPSLEQWSAMSLEARERFVLTVNELLEEPLDVMSKGRPHQTALAQVVDKLGIFFRRTGRKVYLAEELSVLYPGEEPFEPDLLAVLGLEQPAEDERMSWVVADEGRGLDLVMEICYRGDRKKDFEKNVRRYAHLGIAEYFIYDRLKFQIRGYRLPRGGGAYVPIVPAGGRYRSSVLDLELAVHQRRLRFFFGSAELQSQQDLVDQLESIAADLEARAEETERLLLAEGERAERERERADATELRVRAAVLLQLLTARGLALSPAHRAQIAGCLEAPALDRALLRVLTATTLEEVLAELQPSS